jgi:hypothetical protein
MTEDRSPPPEAEACLCRRYSSSQKGGTLIAEDVTDLEEHVRRLNGARYRPGCCPTCGGRMHVHGDRPRLLLGHPAVATVVARFRCATEQCRAVWQVVPAFLARHLWRAWETVEDVAIHGTPTVDVPERTQRRWRARAATSAAMVVTALTMVVSTELICVFRAIVIADSAAS